MIAMLRSSFRWAEIALTPIQEATRMSIPCLPNWHKRSILTQISTNVQCLPNLLANKTKPNLTKAEPELGTAQPKLVSLLNLK